MSSRFVLSLVLVLASCGGRAKVREPRVIPTPSVQVGQCGEPGRDGVMGATPTVDRADRDLDGDAIDENIVADRGMCTPDGNCYWNVFRTPRDGSACSRYVGTFSAATLQPMDKKGEDNMRDVRGYWNLQGGRFLLQSYRFVRGGYQLTDALLCKRAADDRLECTDEDRAP
ncbi:MAG: hypothetical protein AB7L94_37725 [Kofleriaceae bacterium]